MRDGNKESTKELLSTFRTITAIALSLLIFSSNRSLAPLTSTLEQVLFAVSFVLLTVSVATAIYICLIVIPKLLNEVENIIDQAEVRASSFVSLACFMLGCIVLIVIQNI